MLFVSDFRLGLPANTATGLATLGLHIGPRQKEIGLSELELYCDKYLYRQGMRQRRFQRAMDLRTEEVTE